MSDKFYYLESLETIELDEEKKSWINIHRVGTWKHSKYGKVIGSIEKFKKMIENFKNKVIGKDMSMDTRHDHGGALGWVEKLKIVGEKLMALVSWTPIGENLIKNRIYKYISPEYDENYEDKETGEKYGPTLVAVSATNFPFLTKLEPMALSEDLEKDEELKRLIKESKEDPKPIELSDRELEILNSIKEYNWREINKLSDEERECLFDDVYLPFTHPQKRIITKLQQIIYLPFPNFHGCRLRNPGDFQSGAGNWATVSRDHDGKSYNVVMGRLKGESTMTQQAFRYPKAVWSSSEARSHCKSHKGILFEPAGES